MPQSKADQVIEETLETEQLKKPRRRGSGTRRPKTQPLYQTEMQFFDQPLAEMERISPPSASPPPELPVINTPLSLEPPQSQKPARSRSTASKAAPLPTPTIVDSVVTPDDIPSGSIRPTQEAAPSEPKPETSEQKPENDKAHNPPKPGAESSPPGGVITVGGIDFHHASEAEFARLLNYYGIEWEYEPHQFVLQWRDDKPVEMFTPDFYLTEFDMYIELTTMRQSLVRRKNRKLRLIRALYPEISIKLLYRRDYQRLLERFGIPHELLEAEMPGVLEAAKEVEE